MRPFTVFVFLGVLLFFASGLFCQACTSFCLNTSKGTFFGSNLDLQWGDGLIFANRRDINKEGYLTSTLGKTAKWRSKYGSLTFNLVGREYAWCGINEAGLVISTMFLDDSKLPEADARPPLVSGFWVQYMLDNCKSVAEVIAADQVVRLAEDKCHFLAADSGGNCAAIEFLDGKLVYHTGEKLPVKALTNNAYQDLIEHLDKNTLPANDAFHSVQRFKDVAKRISGFNESATPSTADYIIGTLTGVVKMVDAKWSIVFDIKNRLAYFQTKESPALKTFRLSPFDLSCNAQVRMLDINTKLTGDVTSEFTPFDHDRNLAVFLRFCGRWGVDVSPESAKNLMKFIEGFSCGK